MPPPPPPPPPPSASANENNNEHALSGAAFLRRAASAGLVSVVKSSNAPLSIPLPPLLLPRAPSASAVLPSSSSLAAAPAVSAFLPLEGLPAPAGLLRALSAQSLPPQVELRLYRSDGSGALARALSSKKSLAKMASEAAAAATAAAVAPAAAAPPVPAPASNSSSLPSPPPPPSSSSAVARALSRGDSADLAAALLGCRLPGEEGEEDAEPGSPLSSSSSIREEAAPGDESNDDESIDGDASSSPSSSSSLPALFLFPPPPGADSPPSVAFTGPPYSVRKAGAEGTAEARVFVTAERSSREGREGGKEKEGNGNGNGGFVDVSPWHDLPLRAASSPSSSSSLTAFPAVNMVVEIPRGTSAKFEVATSEEKTPIKQDKAKAKKVVAVTVTGAAEGGAADASAAASAAAAPPAPVALRHYELPISWNYGMIPRTFEDPKPGADEVYAAEEAKMEAEKKNGGKSAVSTTSTSFPSSSSPLVPAAKDLKGDGDPLDAVELSERAFSTGDVVPVRILGAFALIDEGELDWKVLCLDARTDNDEGSSKIKIASLAELEAAKPGEVERVVHWFSTYKKLEGGQDGAIGLGGKVLGASRAADVVAEGERAYGKLVSTTAAGSSKEK